MKTISIFLFTLLVIFAAGCNNDNEHMEDGRMNEQMENHEMNSPGNATIDSSIVRDKNVDVASIDQNGDNKVYQCPMDYEVISDHNVNCPLCMMELEEYSVEKARSNLDKSKN